MMKKIKVIIKRRRKGSCLNFHTVLFDMFSEQDFQDVVAVFARIIERLEAQSNG